MAGNQGLYDLISILLLILIVAAKSGTCIKKILFRNDPQLQTHPDPLHHLPIPLKKFEPGNILEAKIVA